mgnify:CR=1 FL=1
MIIGLIAMDSNKGIGINNTIPWQNSDDMKHFKKTTDGQYVIIGSTTYKGLIPLFNSEVLPNRKKFVLSNRDYVGNEIGFSFQEIVKLCKKHNDTYYVIGGKTIYDMFGKENLYNKLIITFIDGSYSCDTYIHDIVFFENFNSAMYFNTLFEIEQEQQITNGIIRTYVKKFTLF